MQIIIDIPDDTYRWIKKNHFVPSVFIEEVCEAIKDGTSLPKGHGRLIDADALYYQYEYADYDFDKTMEYAPTIIEADKAESEVEE